MYRETLVLNENPLKYMSWKGVMLKNAFTLGTSDMNPKKGKDHPKLDVGHGWLEASYEQYKWIQWLQNLDELFVHMCKWGLQKKKNYCSFWRWKIV